MNGSKQVWLITGASSGVGLALAVRVISRGGSVVAAARHEGGVADLAKDHPQQVHFTPVDVAKPGDVHRAVEEAVRRFGQIDVLVNNAGFGLFGAMEELPEQDLLAEFETNVFGALRMIRAVLPQFRRQRAGHIVQISSLEGIAPGLPGESAYAGSKFAMEGVCEGIAQELSGLGIHVTIIEPGPIRTEFASGARVVPPEVEDYRGSIGGALEAFDRLAGNQPNDPIRIADAIITAVDSPAPPLRLVLGQEALEAVRDKLARQRDELDRWAHLTTRTGFAA